jgi:cold shock CspA family protein
MVGRIKSVQRGQGTGYIRESTGRDVFFHKGDVLDRGYNDLEVGTTVDFDLVDDPISGARAKQVRAVRVAKGTT